MIYAACFFAIGLLLLIKGGDFFVDGACAIAHRFRMPEVLIGATIVSIGTTIPEVMVSATGAIEGSSAIAYGNAIGSIICNTALIAAITLIFAPGIIERKSIILPVVFFFIAATIFAAVAYTGGYFSRIIGIGLLVLFAIYLFLSVKKARSAPVEETAAGDKNASGFLAPIIRIVIGAALIAVGANLLVDNGIIIAKSLGVPESVIALTFVAIGTSLPELVTTITSLIKGHTDLSIGNIIGANLINLALVSATAITIRPFGIEEAVGKYIGGINSSLILDIPVMFLVMILLCIPAIIKEKLYRGVGVVLILIYAGYLGFQFIL